MIKFFRKLLRDKRGNALLIAGAALPMLIGAAGLANDTIQWTLWKRQLQRAADSAAIAGVYDREGAGGSTSTVSDTVTHDLQLNNHTWMSLKSGFPTVNYDASCTVSGSTSGMSNRVCVTLAVQQRLPFSSLFMTAAPTITARATAATIASGGTPCMQALESSASATGITNSGNTTVSAPTCILYSNSPSSNSASAGGSSLVTAKAIAGVGGISHSNNWVVQQYIPYSPPLPDPFASVSPDPTNMHCAQAAVTTTTTVVDSPEVGHWTTVTHGHSSQQVWVVDTPAVTHQQTTTAYTGAAQPLSDGVDITTLRDSNGNQANCFSALSVGSNRTLSLPANFGPIYINGGSVNFQGAFNCTGCTLVLTNKDPTSNTIGTLTSNAQANNNITAPTTGTYAGIAIYQDRRASNATNKVNGGSNNVVQGAVYFPKSLLQINGTGNSVSLCAMWVAKNIVLTGNSSITISSPDDASCSGTGLPSASSVRMVRLVA